MFFKLGIFFHHFSGGNSCDFKLDKRKMTWHVLHNASCIKRCMMSLHYSKKLTFHKNLVAHRVLIVLICHVTADSVNLWRGCCPCGGGRRTRRRWRRTTRRRRAFFSRGNSATCQCQSQSSCRKASQS